jgi:hypothetical protein
LGLCPSPPLIWNGPPEPGLDPLNSLYVLPFAATSAVVSDTLSLAQTLLNLFSNSNEDSPPVTPPPSNINDILLPGGHPLGQPGSNPGIRELPGDLNDAQGLFNQLAQGGTPMSGSNYPGTLTQLPSGGYVGLRTYMTGSPGTAATVDVNIPGIPITGIKFNP